MDTWQQLADLPVFAEFYRLVLQLFGIDIGIRGPYGKGMRLLRLLGEGKEVNPFCKALSRQPGCTHRCLKGDAVHGRLATRTGQPVRYVCHMGLAEFIVPIVVEQEIVGHLLCGQVLDHAPTAGDRHELFRRLDWVPKDQWNALWKVYRKSPVIPREKQDSLMSLLHIFVTHTEVTQAAMHEQSPQGRALFLAAAFLKKHFRRDVRLDEVAAAARTSKRNVMRVLRAKTGATMLDHLHRLRIDYACERLRDSDAKIVDVALECGFGSIPTFNRIFRRLIGDTPRRWRQQARRSPPPQVQGRPIAVAE